MESKPNNKFEPYEADTDPEDGLVDNEPHIATKEIINTLDASDRELVEANEVLFEEIDDASDGEERRALWPEWKEKVTYPAFERLVSIVEDLKSQYK